MNWAESQKTLGRLTQRQIFFVGGPPRSGTTWLQQMLDAHPQICCRGEGLFMKHLAEPIENMLAERRQAIEAKNSHLFQHTGGYPLPNDEISELLFGAAVLLSLNQQCAGTDYLAVGEKTPENVFLYPRLKRLFPTAKFIGIVRDPRDILTSAWHFFHHAQAGEDVNAAKFALIHNAIPSLNFGARAMLKLREDYPADQKLVTYENLHQEPAKYLADLFRFLGVSDQSEIVEDCLKKTSFQALSGGRSPGEAQNGSFYRKGAVGDWVSTLTPAMNELILRELGWMFQDFGWQI